MMKYFIVDVIFIALLSVFCATAVYANAPQWVWVLNFIAGALFGLTLYARTFCYGSEEQRVYQASGE